MSSNESVPPAPPTEGDWACACVKRDRAGRLTHICINDATLDRCSRCGATREEVYRIREERRLED